MINKILSQDTSATTVKKLVTISLFALVLYFFYSISNIIVILFFALFLNILFAPFLNFLNKHKIWDFIWILIIYFLILLFIMIVFFSIVPIFIKQISLFAQYVENYAAWLKQIYIEKWIEWFWLPPYIEFFLSHIDINEVLNSVKENAADISKFVATNLKNFVSNWAWILTSFTSAVFNFILVFIFSFFISLERKNIREFFYKVIPARYSKYILSKEDRIINNLTSWLKWQLILWISIFFLTLIWLLILRLFWIEIKEYFSLALIAWMMEFVPYIWPFIALLPAIAIAAWIWYKALIAVFILYIAIQQTENNVLVPYVMSKNLELSPFAVLLAMMIWASLFWVIWIILAIPTVSITQIFLSDYLKGKK